MEEADYLCDRIAIIDHGKIIALDTPLGLKKRLKGDYVSLAIEGRVDLIADVLGEKEWVKEIVSVLPMSYTQAGDNYEQLSTTMSEIHVLENYVLQNQSINLLQLREDYQDPEVNNIWSDETIDVIGRDHEVIKKVRLKNAGDILDAIYDTLSRLGMFT
jgi:ABC-type multidrug transport system ATPase subunit